VARRHPARKCGPGVERRDEPLRKGGDAGLCCVSRGRVDLGKRDSQPATRYTLRTGSALRTRPKAAEDTDALWRARRGALGERIRLRGQHLWIRSRLGRERHRTDPSLPTLARVPETPRCPHCEAPVERVETTEAASSTRGGFRVILVACPSCHKVIGIGGLGPPSGGRPKR
jgi:hypothetical protein